MIDFGFDKLALIGAVALIVIGAALVSYSEKAKSRPPVPEAAVQSVAIEK